MAKRQLKLTLSEAHGEIAEKNVTDRHKRRLREDLRTQTLSVPRERRSAKFALAQWDKLHHKALFAVTILVRALLNVMPELREPQNQRWHVSLGTERKEQSALFRPMLNSMNLL